MTLFQTANLRLEADTPDTATLWLDVADRGVNVFTRQVLDDFDAALDRVAQQPPLQVLVIRSAKASGFMAGADISEFVSVRQPSEASALSESGQRLFAKLERLPQPTIAVIHGPCLGGGLEMALACDYRLVVDQPKTQLGLPEIELGLLPGWGGTQRLPRVVGLENALRMILVGRRLKARDALRWGLADAVTDADAPAELAALGERARAYGKRPKESLPLRTWRERLAESNPIGRALIFRGALRTLRQRVPDDMPAPEEALRAVREGVSHGLEAGLAYEREAIGRLALTSACHNLVNLFFQREKAKKLPTELRTDLVTPIKRVGIVGAGTMGAGIAQLAALHGCAVIVREVNEAALSAGMKKIEDLFHKAVEHRVIPEAEAQAKLASIHRTTSWEGFGDLDLVVEAVIEDLDLKRDVFRDLERETRPTTLLATNTSSLLVERLQEASKRPERIGGLHFFNPVHKMPLIEVVRGPATDEATVVTLTQWAIDLGKTPVVVKDGPGFLVNRILMPYLNEAALLLGDGWPVDRVDRLMRRFGMPMGPLELLDQVGLDVAAHIARALRPMIAERMTPSPLFESMSERKWLGQKSGLGFYQYRGDIKKPNPDLMDALPDEAEANDGPHVPAGGSASQMARDRLVLLMVNEAAMCLGESIVATAEQVDLAMVFGIGWAPHRGGPLHYADKRGIGDVVRHLETMATTLGPRFEPCAELRRRAESGAGFYKPLEELATIH